MIRIIVFRGTCLVPPNVWFLLAYPQRPVNFNGNPKSDHNFLNIHFLPGWRKDFELLRRMSASAFLIATGYGGRLYCRFREALWQLHVGVSS